MWYKTNQVGRIQLEITNYCNAFCPQCERAQMDPKDLNNKYMTLAQVERTFAGDWSSLQQVHFCGNQDEPTINPDLEGIIHFFSTKSPNAEIYIATNGGTRTTKFWQDIGKLSLDNNVFTVFGIDGLEDTNHLYRKNVKWDRLQRNFRAYIAAGGNAVWQFIPFEWNAHQIDDCREMSKNEGFKTFVTLESVRE